MLFIRAGFEPVSLHYQWSTLTTKLPRRMVAIFDCCKHLKKVKIQLFANFTTGFLQAGLEPAFIEFNQSCKVNLLYGSLFGSE